MMTLKKSIGCKLCNAFVCVKEFYLVVLSKPIYALVIFLYSLEFFKGLLDLPTKKRYSCQDLAHGLSEPSGYETA